MPLTRSQRTSRASAMVSNTENIVPSTSSSTVLSSIAGALKRKADGRTVLGDISTKNALTSRKPLATKSSNKFTKNVTQTSKQSKVLDDKFPRLLESRKNSLNQPRKEFTGHDSFMLVPLDMYRLELRDELKRNNKFYDIEKENADNHFESPAFSFGVFEYMKWREEQFEFTPYLDGFQTNIGKSDRRSFIDWMVEYQEIAEVNHETLYLAVRLCDYFFARKKIAHAHLQLYGFVGFLLASKFEERWPPTFEDMIYISDDAYTRDDIINAELAMLKVLDFDINIPHAYRYLRRYSKCCGMDMKCLTVARFYLEITLMEYEYVTESQSMLASACLWMTLLTLGYDPESRQQTNPIRKYKKHWTDLLTYYTGHHEWDIIPLAMRILNSVRLVQEECKNVSGDTASDPGVPESTLRVVYKKYASETFFSVAKFPVVDQETAERHMRRARSDRMDFEAAQEPCTKRNSNGCTSELKRMTLRSRSPQNVENTPLTRTPIPVEKTLDDPADTESK